MPAVRGLTRGRAAATRILPAGLELRRVADVPLGAGGKREVDPPGDRTVGRRLEIRRAANRRRDDVAFGARLGAGFQNRPAVRIEAAVPRLRHEGRPREELAVRPIEHVEVAVAIGVHQQLPRLAVEGAIDEHHVLVRVPVVRVVRRELVVPLACAGRRIERDHRTAEQVVALTHGAVVERTRIADRPIHQIEVGIVRAGQPGRAATQLPGIAGPGVVSEFAGTGNRREAPQARAGRRIVGVDEAADPELAAGDAGDDLVLHRQRRAGDAEALHRIGDLHFPEQRTGPGVERQERRVERADEDPVAEHRDAAVERVDLVRVADLLRPLIAPDLPSRRASSATTVPGAPLVYMMPSMTSGVASSTELPGSWRAHAACSRRALSAVI